MKKIRKKIMIAVKSDYYFDERLVITNCKWITKKQEEENETK